MKKTILSFFKDYGVTLLPFLVFIAFAVVVANNEVTHTTRIDNTTRVKRLQKSHDFYKFAWDQDFEYSKAQQAFKERHPNMIYYASATVYYCPMVVDCPLMPCGSTLKEIPVWVSANGQRFRRGYVVPPKSDSLFENGLTIYWDNGGFSTIDTSNTWFTVY